MKIKRGDGLNIVPFIDIMLVLLAIVLSVSTFIAQGKIKVDVPNASDSKVVKENNKKLLIVINKDNQIYIDDKEVSTKELESKLESLPKDEMVQFKGDKKSSYDNFVLVLNLLAKNGHDKDKFEIITEKR
ncbi:TonB system transport protein ExbD [Helicobacter sp. 11S02629-2]|uniref:TonB system transport protein ExbD n=1 Tax=Helicobacter sp. 11S02629-2 TaxID=1476195 RepID=UPI000BA75003|nr:TonB system transport protein ExbD [Helicobacter sp. 11S02629-2]PAF43491.1 TonB system transport protein ExbD [Helicobacter sp. 11S02629-2]